MKSTFYHSQDQFFVEIPPSQIPTRNLKKLVLRMIKFVFHKEKLDPIDTVNGKHFIILKRSFSWDFDLVEFERTGKVS